jgi:hypothetical protein
MNILTAYENVPGFLSKFKLGRAIAQAVICRISTATVRVRAEEISFGICGGKSGTGTGFL